ncbi:hypothetical protein A8W25_14490 [Streptomyces sp. ERV7]|uniref:hypothetical protein n=1 Tax=Streptomyces sp. ERV7 TaxID=1322334 RepID=UPI0007F37389|nr:hypothetical protein [Streptomyces sp. ERV7]OAR23720.1 hypothetical protein A8W25_14490 [Streptomyces sp. ERV7]
MRLTATALATCVLLLGGVSAAAADDGGLADNGSNAGVATVNGSGVGDDAPSATDNGGFTEIDQSNANVAVNFSELW